MQKTYIDAVRSVVAQRGLRGSKVSIKEVWRVDLEGDGQDEVIVLAESREYDPGIYRQGQFSLVMLRKILDGRVKDLLLSNELHVKKPRFPGSLNGDEFPFQYWIDGFWDVDGDGTLEIVAGFSCMRTDYGGVDIWKLRKGKAYKLASEGVGF